MTTKSQRYESAIQCGERVRTLRKQLGYTLEEVGEKAGFSGAQIYLVEKGRINTPVETLARIAQALGVPVRALFCEEDQGALPPVEARKPRQQDATETVLGSAPAEHLGTVAALLLSLLQQVHQAQRSHPPANGP